MVQVRSPVLEDMGLVLDPVCSHNPVSDRLVSYRLVSGLLVSDHNPVLKVSDLEVLRPGRLALSKDLSGRLALLKECLDGSPDRLVLSKDLKDELSGHLVSLPGRLALSKDLKDGQSVRMKVWLQVALKVFSNQL